MDLTRGETDLLSYSRINFTEINLYLACGQSPSPETERNHILLQEFRQKKFNQLRDYVCAQSLIEIGNSRMETIGFSSIIIYQQSNTLVRLAVCGQQEKMLFLDGSLKYELWCLLNTKGEHVASCSALSWD